MNERIKELAEQAGIPAIDGEWDYNDRNLLVKDNGEWRAAVSSEIISTMIQSERGLEKFAQLIVRECLEIVNRKEYSYHEADPLWETAELIKEHFGVK